MPYRFCVHARAVAIDSPEINWIRYPWETSAISGFVTMHAGEIHPCVAQSDLRESIMEESLSYKGLKSGQTVISNRYSRKH